VAFGDTRHLDRLFAARDPAEALVESTPDLILAEDPDEERGHPASGKLSRRFADERAAQTLALMRGQDVDRGDLAFVDGISGALGTADREADNLSGFLRDEAELRVRLRELAEAVPAPLDVRPHVIEERVRKETAIGRLPGADAYPLESFGVIDRRATDAYVRGARRTSRRSGARARRGVSVSRRA
jgi:hypothetical protein